MGFEARDLKPGKGSERPAALAKPVADRAHRRYQVGLLLSEFGPEPTDVDVDCAAPP